MKFPNKYIEDSFTDNFSEQEIALFGEALLNDDDIIKQRKITEDFSIYIIEVSPDYPYCVVLECRLPDVTWSYQVFNELMEADIVFNYIVAHYQN